MHLEYWNFECWIVFNYLLNYYSLLYLKYDLNLQICLLINLDIQNLFCNSQNSERYSAQNRLSFIERKPQSKSEATHRKIPKSKIFLTSCGHVLKKLHNDWMSKKNGTYHFASKGWVTDVLQPCCFKLRTNYGADSDLCG